jgi:hypothetical protein
MKIDKLFFVFLCLISVILLSGCVEQSKVVDFTTYNNSALGFSVDLPKWKIEETELPRLVNETWLVVSVQHEKLDLMIAVNVIKPEFIEILFDPQYVVENYVNETRALLENLTRHAVNVDFLNITENRWRVYFSGYFPKYKTNFKARDEIFYNSTTKTLYALSLTGEINTFNEYEKIFDENVIKSFTVYAKPTIPLNKLELRFSIFKNLTSEFGPNVCAVQQNISVYEDKTVSIAADIDWDDGTQFNLSYQNCKLSCLLNTTDWIGEAGDGTYVNITVKHGKCLIISGKEMV